MPPLQFILYHRCSSCHPHCQHPYPGGQHPRPPCQHPRRSLENTPRTPTMPGQFHTIPPSPIRPFFYALNFLIGISLFLKDQWVIYTWPGKREMCLCRSACCLCWRCHLLPLYTAARGFESSKKIY